VDGQREAVRVVVQQHDDVRGPAADEQDEDDKHRFHLANSLHYCHVSGFSSILQQKATDIQLANTTHYDYYDITLLIHNIC